MGFSGWDAAKEHRRVKNKKAFTHIKHYNQYQKFGKDTFKKDALIPDESVKANKNNFPIQILKIVVAFSFLIVMLFLFRQYFGMVFRSVFEPNPYAVDLEKERLREMHENAYKVLMESGNNFFYYEDYKNAIREYELLLNIYPDNLNLEYQNVLAYIEQCRTQKLNCYQCFQKIDALLQKIEYKKQWNDQENYLRQMKLYLY